MIGGEVTIAGAGIVGLACGFELARRGTRVKVLEPTAVGAGATAASAGMLAPVSEADVEEDSLLRLAFDSLERYPTFVRGVERISGLPCRYRDDGTLWVATHRDDEAEIDHLRGALRARGLAAEMLTADEALDLEPHLSGRVLSALRVAGDHQVDPRAMARALAAGILALGGEVQLGVRVVGIAEVGAHLTGLVVEGGGSRQTLPTSRALLAAGAWLSRDIEGPTRAFGVRPIKGQLLRLKGPPLVRHVLRAPACYLVPREDGELLIGATVEELGFDEQPTAGGVLDLLREARLILPGIYDLNLAEISVGLRPAVQDQRPIIGQTAVEGLFVAGAHYRNGILLAPATAHWLAQWLETGQAPDALAAFGADRPWR